MLSVWPTLIFSFHLNQHLDAGNFTGLPSPGCSGNIADPVLGDHAYEQPLWGLLAQSSPCGLIASGYPTQQVILPFH